jgi:hypothetical protein
MGKTIIRELQQDRNLPKESEVTLEQTNPKIQKMLDVTSEDVRLGRTMGLEELDRELGFTGEDLNT